MRNDLTDLTVVLDRSGSMASCQSDAEGGLNTFIEKQKATPGECLFTLVQFDTEYEFVHRGTPIQNVGRCTLEPRGSTALLDALGRAINETGQRLQAMDEAQRPGLVAFLVITDGQENASREFSKPQIKQMIEHQKSVYNWQFTFLGANQDAFVVAGSMGFPAANVANYAVGRTETAFDVAGRQVLRMRRQSANCETLDGALLDEEREEMK